MASFGSWEHDVFLNFRGEDTRKNFVDHLYSALEQHGIHTYKDDVTLDRGDTIGPALLKAIKKSHILVIVFSENYADSPWCLNELSHIMKCRGNNPDHIVFPIFYNVDPSEVRNQKRKYGKAFAKHKSENSKSKVESWKKALFDASNIAGWKSKHGQEAKCILAIVGSILGKMENSLNTNESLHFSISTAGGAGGNGAVAGGTGAVGGVGGAVKYTKKITQKIQSFLIDTTGGDGGDGLVAGGTGGNGGDGGNCDLNFN